MKISTAAKKYLIEIEVRKFTPKTIWSYRNNLNLFLRFCEEEAGVTGIENVSLAVVRQFSRFMSERGKKGSYINGLLKVAKAFIQYCYEEGYGGFNTRKNFKWCKQDKAVILAFSVADVRQMLRSCKGCDYLQIRDAAILTMLFETGIRCWELCCIQKQSILYQRLPEVFGWLVELQGAATGSFSEPSYDRTPTHPLPCNTALGEGL